MAGLPRIGMIGDGNVGSALTEGLTRADHEVKSVGNDPPIVRDIGRWAEVVVLAVPFGERANALRELGDGVRGKVLVDVSNALTPDYDFALDLSRSGAEEVQELAPGAKVVKAFNTVFAQHMSRGQVRGEPLTVFAAGDDDEARETVLDMARAIGFDAVDAGPLRNARWLEVLGFLNITLGYGLEMGKDIGFKLIHPGAPSREAPARGAAARER